MKMANPPSGLRITKNGFTYKSNIDRTKYTIKELSRAALRDVGRLIVRRARDRSRIRNHMSATVMKSRFHGKDGAFSWWVRKQETDMQVGIKHDTWYGVLQELDDGVRAPSQRTTPRKKRNRKPKVDPNAPQKQKKKKKKRKQQPLGHQILITAVKESIDDIRRIEGRYLSAIEDENRALGLIKDEETEPHDNE